MSDSLAVFEVCRVIKERGKSLSGLDIALNLITY